MQSARIEQNVSFLLGFQWLHSNISLNWSGGAAARARDEIQARGAGHAGPACPPSVRACVRPCETLKRGPKGLQNHQNPCSCIVKREKVKSYIVWKIGRLAKCTKKDWFGTRFGNFPLNRKIPAGFSRLRNAKTQLFHLCAESFTKRFRFCFKSMINFQSGRKVQMTKSCIPQSQKSIRCSFGSRNWNSTNCF